MNEFEMLTEHPDNDKQKDGFELRKTWFMLQITFYPKSVIVALAD